MKKGIIFAIIVLAVAAISGFAFFQSAEAASDDVIRIATDATAPFEMVDEESRN